ncbi:hypothetical protein RIF29_35246 [Crotalaria pallida]|uniref:Nucleotide-diphospho-sugar transferase domain-containing protein n=1 Tax=Crotalaria pallida TaxID=3830 RepID=A0AAN9EAX5_CROPI
MDTRLAEATSLLLLRLEVLKRKSKHAFSWRVLKAILATIKFLLEMASSTEKAVMVLAIDEHEHSNYALEWTLDRFFTPYGSDAPFKLVLVNAKSSTPVAGTGALGAEFLPAVESQLKQLADQITEKATQICVNKSVHGVVMEVVEGDARNVLCDAVERHQASLLVLGSHGYGAIKRAVIGSVSDHCVHRARCSVMIVKKPKLNLFNNDVWSLYMYQGNYEAKLESVLRSASMEDKTVIITTVNNAWAEPGSIFDIFLESFRVGNQTKKLLNHLVIITWDKKAHARCIALHPHCFQIETKGSNYTNEAFFMTPNYLHMMWRRIEFLGSVLEMGYSFVFTDSDIMWFRDPFKQFYKDTDIQIACDVFKGDSSNMKNFPNGGFAYVKSNSRTIWFYKFWYMSRIVYPTLHDQDVLNKIKQHPFISRMRLRIRFLSTTYFGGFCQASKDFNKVCTMHANCCVGLGNKVNDLKILIEDWKKYMALPENEKTNSPLSWSAPKSCK